MNALLPAALLFLNAHQAGAVADQSKTPTSAARVETMFAKWDHRDSPGCSVAVIRAGRVVFQKSFGSANLDHEAPNTSKTVFEVGSATKSFVCACLALLLDEGKIAPGDDVRKFIPELHRHKTPILIEHLIRCRSGTWDHWHAMQLAGWKSEPIESPYRNVDVLQVLAGQKRLPFQPGAKFKYSSGDYFLLGVVIKRVTGKSLAEFAHERLFKPLGMTRTYFEVDSTRIVKARATGYYRDLGGRWRHWTTHSGGVGGWGLKTCVDDLIRWNANFDDSRLPKGKHLDEFLKTGTLLGNANVVDANAGKKYRGLKRVQCTGGMPGFLAAMTRFPEKKLTVICLSNNSSEIRPSNVAQRIADAYIFDGPISRPKKPPPKVSKPVKLALAQLRDKVGVWRSRYGFLYRVVFENDRLYFVHHFKKKYLLKALSESHFEPVGYPGAGNRLVFERTSPRRPYMLSLQWTGGKERYEPITLSRPSAKQLQEYTGKFTSEEMHATYRFRVRLGKLWLRVNSHGWERLEATVRDEFIPQNRRTYDNRIFRFRRDRMGKVTSVGATLWRVSDVVFSKDRRTVVGTAHAPQQTRHWFPRGD